MASIHTNIVDGYIDYLRDESRKTGNAQSISFPRTEDEIPEVLNEIKMLGLTLTIQGGRTGLAAGAVPFGGHIMNLSRMNRIKGISHSPNGKDYIMTVQPGIALIEVKKAVATKAFDTAGWTNGSLQALEDFKKDRAFFFSPDPTEESAAIGGIIACNASGARSFYYGPSRSHIERLKMILPDTTILEIKRGSYFADGRRFSLKTSDGKEIKGELPSYSTGDVKCAAGYYSRQNMDLIDLFIGSEGTFGIITEADIRLLPLPKAIWGLMVFLPTEDMALLLTEKIRASDHRPAAIEFFDKNSLNMLKKQKEINPAFGDLPGITVENASGIYIEIHGDDEAQVETTVFSIAEIISEIGGDPDNTWMASDEKEILLMKKFRHAVPEIINMLIDERKKQDKDITKLGTDLAVPDSALRDIFSTYHQSLDNSDIEYAIFGHIGNNHVHVNIIPRSIEDYEAGRRMYLGWAKKAVELGGTVSAEHGIGKLKSAMLLEMYGKHGVEEMIRLKNCFDPDWLLNPGNLFSKST